MKRFMLPILLCMLAHSGIAQNSNAKIAYESFCPEMAFCKDCGDTKASFNGNIRKYIEKEINWRDLDAISGVIVLHVLVDSTGSACVKNIYNHTANPDADILQMDLDRLVERMPKWKPAMVNNQPINSAVPVALYSRIEKHQVFDVDYLRNDRDRKWVTKDGRKIFATASEHEETTK